MTSGGGSKPAVVGGVGLALAALLAFLLKHAEPQRWDSILARIGIGGARTLLVSPDEGTVSAKKQNPFTGTKIPSGFLSADRPPFPTSTSDKSLKEDCRVQSITAGQGAICNFLLKNGGQPLELPK